MKKYILPIAIIAIVSLSSCRKERTCSCTVTTTSNGSGTSSNEKYTVGHATKREAKRITGCYSSKSTETRPGVLGTTITIETVSDCKLD